MLIKFEVQIELPIIRFDSLLLERFEQVHVAVHGERRLAKDTHDFKDGPTNGESDFFSSYILHHTSHILHQHCSAIGAEDEGDDV